MKRIKLIVSYDGTNYVGWQVQKNGLAVEQVINEHLRKLLKEDITIIGASRTDSGVHAAGNVAVFDTETRIPAEKIFLALNQGLPDDIKIVSSEEVDPDFHPRYHAKTKTYQYTILNSRYYAPLYRLYAGYVFYRLDVDKMREAAQYLVGEHDFLAFSTAGGQQKSSIRTIHSIVIETEPLGNHCGYALAANGVQQPSEGRAEAAECAGSVERAGLAECMKLAECKGAVASDTDGQPAADGFVNHKRVDYEPQLIRITINGNGFLYNMVRIITGTLIKVGMGIYPPEYVKEILDSRDRRLSAPKAAACGLTLLEIEY